MENNDGNAPTENSTIDEPPPTSANQPIIMWPPLPPDHQKPPLWMLALSRAPETCVFKSAIAGAGGYGLGLFFGLLFGGYSSAVDKAVEMEGPALMKLRVGFREAGKAMSVQARQFALFGALYSGVECIIEKARARTDIYNATMAGCITGGTLASQPRVPMPAKTRAIQMATGCATIAAFSSAIDYYMFYKE